MSEDEVVTELELFDRNPELKLLAVIFPRLTAVANYIFERSASCLAAMTNETTTRSGLTIEAFVDELQRDPELGALFVAAAEATYRMGDERHARMLGMVVAQALTDRAKLDEAPMLAATIHELTPPHARALVLLADDADEREQDSVTQILRSTSLQHRRSDMTLQVVYVLSRRLGCDVGIAQGIVAALQRQGLVWADPPGFTDWGITAYGERILAYLCAIPETARPDIPAE